MTLDLGSCSEHPAPHRYCGFQGVPDLKEWAKSRRARFRLEASYRAERDAHVKGDGRWYIELLGTKGIIYPKSAEYGATSVKGKTREALLRLDPRVVSGPRGDRETIVWFPWSLLEDVAAAIGLRRKRAMSPERVQVARERMQAFWAKKKALES